MKDIIMEQTQLNTFPISIVPPTMPTKRFEMITVLVKETNVRMQIAKHKFDDSKHEISNVTETEKKPKTKSTDKGLPRVTLKPEEPKTETETSKLTEEQVEDLLRVKDLPLSGTFEEKIKRLQDSDS